MSSPSDPPSGPSEPADGPPIMSVPMAVGWACGITFLLLLLHGVVAAFRPGAPADVVLGVGCQAAAYLLGLFLILRLHAPDASIRDVTGLRATHLAFYPLAILLGLALELPANALFGVITRKWPTGPDEPLGELFQAASTPGRALIALGIALVGPVLEELLFRGALFRLLRKTHAAELVILVTAALFTLAHVDWQFFLPIGFLALALSYLRTVSGSLVPSLLMHATFNGASLALSLAVLRSPTAADEATPLGLVAASTAAAFVVLGGVHLVGAHSTAAARARELDAG